MPDSPPSLGVRTHLVAELRYMARAFVPVAIVILAPLLLIDLGLVAVDPGVLWAIFELLLVFALAVTAAVVPTGLLSMVALIGAYLRRLRARIEARRAAASGAEP